MDNFNKAKNIAFTTATRANTEGELFNEYWDYTSIVEMLMYLVNISRQDIIFAVNQCARFTKFLKVSHIVVVKCF